MSPVNESPGSASAGGSSAKVSTTGDVYVDLTYRGLTLASRVKLTDVRPDAGFLQLAEPMPVGTALVMATGEGPVIQVTVAEVREQTTPGVIVKPALDSATQPWWMARVTAPEQVGAQPSVEVVRPTRTSPDSEFVDDGRVTEVMEAAVPLDSDLAKPADKSRDRSRKRRKRR